MTEVSDLEVVMDAASGWDFVDEDRIVLLGTSQGGELSLQLRRQGIPTVFPVLC